MNVSFRPHRVCVMTGASLIALSVVAEPAVAQSAPQQDATPTQPSQTQSSQTQSTQTSSTPQTESPAPPQPEPAASSEITVTASRAGGSGFIAPTPTTVLGAAAIDQRQSTNIAQILREVPAFKATTNPSANAIRTQNPGASLADLRGLGASRTLVLVNGARVPPLAPASNGSTSTAVDLNTVPTLMVDRIEVVTGGASAQWGSDAVGGVINIILKNRFEGLEVRVQSGISERGDGGQRRIGVLAGTAFGEGGHVVIGADYVKSDEVGDVYTRDWGYKEYGRVANSAFATNGQAASIIATNVHAAMSPGGLITGPASFSLRNYEFTSATTVSPFDLGGIRSATVQIGGQGESLAKGVSLAPGIERFNPYLRAEYQFSDALTLSLQAAYSISRATLLTLPARDTAVTILATNPYIPAAVRTELGALPSFTISRIDYDLGNARVNVRNETPTVVVGGEGSLGGGWAWDAHAGWGRNDYTNRVPNNRNIAKFRFAADAIMSNGQIVCRATVPGPDFNAAAAGCVPINLLGNGTPSAAAIDYVTDASTTTARYTQTTAAANLRGSPFETWAGPVRLALGAEYRRETEVVRADAVGAIGGYEIANAVPYSGKFDVKEGYVEAIVPLARDVPFLHSLDLNGAVRVADYSSAGVQTTWKVGATWEPVAGLRFRGTRSRDIRAPAIYELASNGAVSNATATVNGVTANIPQTSTNGNPDLRPETANTVTVGVVLQPRFVPGLSISVDYFDINLRDAISTVSGATAGNLCSAGQTYYCSLFTFSGTMPIAYKSGYMNAPYIHPNGLDIAGSYRLPMTALNSSWDGALTFAFSGTYTFHYYQNLSFTGSAPIDYAGDNSEPGTARFRSNSSVTYDQGPFSITGQVTTISAGNKDNTANLSPASTINDNHVPAVAYVNLQTSLDVTKRMRVFGGINNLLDRDPPAVPTLGVAYTNGVYYDTIGRAFTVGVNLKW